MALNLVHVVQVVSFRKIGTCTTSENWLNHCFGIHYHRVTDSSLRTKMTTNFLLKESVESREHADTIFSVQTKTIVSFSPTQLLTARLQKKDNDGTCLRWIGNGTRIKLAWKKRKHIKARIRHVVSFFVFYQANLILVPFPTHRQQVPSIS